MKNIHLIPTPNPSRLLKTIPKGNLLLAKENIVGSHWENQHIYITSDEEIKRNDYFLSLNDDESFMEIIKNNEVDDFSEYADEDWVENCKKIILTTDEDLIKDGVQSINDEFLEWFVKNPSCEEVEVEKTDTFKKTNEVYIDEITKGNYYEVNKQYKIIIPKEELVNCEYCGGDGIYVDGDNNTSKCTMCEKGKIPKEEPLTKLQIAKNIAAIGIGKKEPKQIKCYCGHTTYCDCSPLEEPKQETLEEASWKFNPLKKLDGEFLRHAFKEGAKWQQERSYSEEEVIEIAKQYAKRCQATIQSTQWLTEQFKKK